MTVSHKLLTDRVRKLDKKLLDGLSDAGFQLAFSAVRNNRRLIGIVFGGDSGTQRNTTVELLMNKGFSKININVASITKKLAMEIHR